LAALRSVDTADFTVPMMRREYSQWRSFCLWTFFSSPRGQSAQQRFSCAAWSLTFEHFCLVTSQ